MSGGPHPRATYRLQLRQGMDLHRAASLVPYLARLGVSHLYTSPATAAVPGSTHGYDVSDPTCVDPAIGGEEGHRAVSEALEREGMGRLVDIVPNHLAAHESNPWWADVVERGQESEWSQYFDIDWESGGGRVITDPARPNYRRFFDISGLVGARVEVDTVFDRTHQLVLGWLSRGEAHGLRVDHPDGLRYPAQYFARLAEVSGQAWTVVEKILAVGEELPDDWAVNGSTGYEFCRRVTGLQVDGDAEDRFTALYAELTGAEPEWEVVSPQARHEVLRGSLAGDLRRLAEATAGATGRPVDDVSAELAERLATFPVYRDYPPPGAPDHEVRFAQLCAAVTAKGVEDTSFYRYTRFCALNEVGSEPDHFGTTLDEFHAANERAAKRWPLGLLTSSTHDTKWGEDVRARMAVLSEVPDEWELVARRWMGLGELDVLEPTLRYALLQALVGAWPISTERVTGYLEKAMREAKTRTSWAEPDEAYERAVLEGVRSLLATEAFRADMSAFARPVAQWGRINSLAATVLKLTSPGVPDVYQGTEMWEDSLVDPDNRRPVDFELRTSALAALPDQLVMESAGSGTVKLGVIHRLLRMRAQRPDTMGPASEYEELEVGGGAKDHVVAFRRGDDVAVAVPRLARLMAAVGETASVALPAGRWVDVLTGSEVSGGRAAPVAELWAGLPVAALLRVT